MPICLPVGCQASCVSDRLSICLSVCLSIGLPLCFPIKSVCPSNGQTSLPSLKSPAVCLHDLLSVSLSVYPLISQAGCPSAFQFLFVFSSVYLSVGQSYLPICLPVHLPCYIPCPHFSPCVQVGSLITKDHLSALIRSGCP